jgi:hypothetical protein
MNLPFVWEPCYVVRIYLLQYHVPRITCLQNKVLQANPRRVTVGVIVQE